MSKAYKASGVDIHAGYKSVELIKPHVKSTFRKEVLTDIGGFGGMFSLAKIKEMEEPVMISGTDSVGTKVKLAFLMDKHDTIGIDCVAMCVNDIICNGAEPLFFLDYIGCGKNYPEKIEMIVKGVAEGCRMSGAALVGGETAEMPGVYAEDEYDLVGFAAGVVDRKKAIDGKNIKEGDVLIAVASSGLHSNGYSLVREILRPCVQNINEYVSALGTTLGEELLKPTRIYAKTVLELIKQVEIKGICNITGGGLIENVPRMLPDGLKAVIETQKWEVPKIFKLLQTSGKIDKIDMYNTFNMGVGMVFAVDKASAAKTREVLKNLGENAFEIGFIGSQVNFEGAFVEKGDEVFEGAGIELCLK